MRISKSCSDWIYFPMPNREEKLASGAALDWVCDTGVSLHSISAYHLIVLGRKEEKVPYFSSNTGPFIASTRPYFLLRVETSKNSS